MGSSVPVELNAVKVQLNDTIAQLNELNARVKVKISGLL